jgi:chemotaxis regulatin CheY-phosphate phosphatase CheZ
MILWFNIFQSLLYLLRLRRKKTLVDRVQGAAEDVADRFTEVAEDVYDRLQDVAGDVVERVQPVVSRSGRSAQRVVDRTERKTGRALASTAALASLARSRTERTADDTAERVAEAIEAARERLAPLLRQSERAAETALARTTGTVSAKVEEVEQAGRGAAQATAGFFGSLGSAVAGFARAAWAVTLFLIKAAVLIGVAYAGWEWLQSRRQNEFWSTPSYSPPTSGGPGGSNAAGNAYGSGSAFPSPAGAVG